MEKWDGEASATRFPEMWCSDEVSAAIPLESRYVSMDARVVFFAAASIAVVLTAAAWAGMRSSELGEQRRQTGHDWFANDSRRHRGRDHGALESDPDCHSPRGLISARFIPITTNRGSP